MKPITAFLLVASVLSIGLRLVARFAGAEAGQFRELDALFVLIPALAAFMMSLWFREKSCIQWKRLPLNYLPVALFLMPVLAHVAMLSLMLASEGHLSGFDWLRSPDADGFYHLPTAQGSAKLTKVGLVVFIPLKAAIDLSATCVFVLFEEIGWRGWLLPRMMGRFGLREGIVLTAIVGGIWRVFGIQYSDGMTVTQVALGALPVAFGAGFIIGWLWFRTESIWIATLANAALISWGQLALKYMQEPAMPSQVKLLGTTAILLLLTGTGLLWRGLDHRTTVSAGGP